MIKKSCEVVSIYSTLYRFILILVALAPGLLHAADNPKLIGVASGEYRGPVDPVRVELQQSLPNDLLRHIRIEIDAIDVTDFLQNEGLVLSYFPPEPLSSGKHNLRLVAVLPDGEINELGVWTFETRHSRSFREVNIEQELNIQGVYNIDDSYTQELDDTTVQGVWAFKSIHADGDWRLSNKADFIYNQQKEQTFRGEQFDVNEFLVKADLPQSTLQLGHHEVAAQSLILSQFNRRGVSARVETEDKRFDASGFSMRTEAIAGFHHGMGVSDNNNRTSGAVVNGHPFSANPESLKLSAIYLTGKGASEGIYEVADDVSSGGDAVAIVADIGMLDHTLRLRAEAAQTDYDFDGENTGFASKKDTAHSLLLHYTPQSQENYTWDAGLKYQKVMPWFYSTGYSNLASDREETQLFANLDTGGWSVNAIVLRRYDNVDEDITLPQIRSDVVSAGIAYMPVQENESSPSFSIFSNPGYNLTVSRSRDKQQNQPAGFSGEGTDYILREASLQANFSADDWSWGLHHGVVLSDDNTNTSSDTINRVTSLDAGLPVNQYISMGAQIQRNDLQDIDTSIDAITDAAMFSLTVNYPRNWSTVLSHTLNREKTSDDSIDTRSNITEASMQWNYRQASGNRPGVAFFINANYQTFEDVAVETYDYQTFMGINVSWSAKY